VRRDDQQGIVAGDYIVDVLKGKKVAVLHDKDTYGQGLADATKAQLEKRGVTPVLYEGLTRGEKDFSAVVTKIRGAGADVVYFGGLHPEAGPLVRQLREQGLKDVKFMSDDGIVTDELVTTAGGPQYVDGVLMTFGADPRLLPDSKTVVDEFRKAGTEPKATPCTPTRRSRPWPPPSTAPNPTRAKTPPMAQGQPGQDRHGREGLGQQGRPESVRLRGLPVGQDGKYHQLEKQK
jgi:branched-chain amino acid transport system substrate-binding protein